MNVNPVVVTAKRHDRLRWSLELGGVTHELALLPDLAPGVVKVVVDGDVVANVRMPSPEHPWIEQRLDVGGEPITVAMANGDAMASDLFHGDRSVVDGRSLADARGAAPAPVVGYNRWFSDFAVWKQRPSRRDVAGLIVFLAVLVLVLTAMDLARGSPLDRAAGASLVVALMLALWLAAIIAWMSGLAWVNARLLRLRALNDGLRLLIFASSFVAIPAAAIFALTVAVALLR